MFTTDKAGDKADFEDHTRKYLSKGYDKLKVYKPFSYFSELVNVFIIC